MPLCCLLLSLSLSECFALITPILDFKTDILIPEGFYALVADNGKELQTSSGSWVWEAGFYFKSPFVQVTQLVTKQFVVFDSPVKGCKTRDDVTVTINSSIVFRIMGDPEKGEDSKLIPKFVHDVTPAGLQQQLV